MLTSFLSISGSFRQVLFEFEWILQHESFFFSALFLETMSWELQWFLTNKLFLMSRMTWQTRSSWDLSLFFKDMRKKMSKKMAGEHHIKPTDQTREEQNKDDKWVLQTIKRRINWLVNDVWGVHQASLHPFFLKSIKNVLMSFSSSASSVVLLKWQSRQRQFESRR